MADFNAEYINPFLMASTKVIKDACRIDVVVGKPRITTAEFDEDSFLILMGVTGAMKGQVILKFEQKGALEIASSMCMMLLPELDELAQSAISELCNMILGNTATLFSVKGINIDITPPTLCVGNVTFSNTYAANLCVPLLKEGEELMQLNIALKKE